MVGLVEERQVDRFQIDEADAELPMRPGGLHEPFGDREAGAFVSDAGDDDMQVGHDLNVPFCP